jgi:hypothetical protein
LLKTRAYNRIEMNIESDFIKQLYKDIDNKHVIYHDPKKFIKYNNLRKIKFKHNPSSISAEDFPVEASIGSIYLIKGVNIIGMYCWYDYKHSLYLQMNKFASRWICKTEIYNKAIDDPEQLEYYIDDMDVLFSSDTAHYLMLQFVQSGFDMYVIN